MLLHWATLEPCGSSSITSVRFSSPNPEIISQTEPDAFILSVFLNAQAVPSIQEPKPKGTNILVPTRLTYTGGLREFPLDMGPEFVTRLMVVQGDFARVTIAVYGDAVSEPPTVPVTYEPQVLPALFRHRLSAALDPSNSVDPTLLPRGLLALVMDAPSLSRAIRFACCLKTTDGERNSTVFSFANVEECLETELSGLNWLENACHAMTMLVHEDVNVDLLKSFAEKIPDALSDKTNEHVNVTADILRHIAAQPPIVTQTIVELLDVSDIFEISLLDNHILDRLRDAASNPIIARALRTAPMLETLRSLRDADSTSRLVKYAADGLLERVLGWERFEKALSNPIPELAAVARWIKEIASEEMTLGVFLLSLIEEECLESKIAGFPVQEQPVSPPAPWHFTGLTSSTEFIAFVRAFIGVSCVVTLLCWMDNISNNLCKERIFTILRLWQQVDGYREIVNHLLLLPQLTYHLESVLKNTAASNPSLSDIHVEQIVASLYAQPESMARPELATLLEAIPPSPSSISEHERLEMVEISTIAEGGSLAALKTILNWSNRPMDTSSARALQAALLILEKAIEDRETGEWNVMQAAWQDGSHGLVYGLVEMFQQLVVPIHCQFLLTPPSPLQPATLAQLLSSSITAMRILSRLLPVYPLPNRLNRMLTHHIATLFITTDAVDSRYAQGSPVCQLARVARPTCAEALSVLSALPDESELGGVGGELVLRTLLHSARYPEGDDPVTRLEQVFWLLDLVLPLPMSDSSGDRTKQRFWTRIVIPNLLPELQRFLRALAVDHQVQLVKRLAELDQGEVGLGQWFVDEEFKYLLQAIDSFKATQSESGLSDLRSISQARVANSVQFLTGLIKALSTGGTSEFLRKLNTLQDTSRVLAALVEDPAIIPSVIDFACIVAPHASLMEPQAQLDAIVLLLRSAKSQPSALIHAANNLHLIDQVSDLAAGRLAGELGPMLQRLGAEGEDTELYWVQEKAVAQAVMSCLSWLVSQPSPETLLLPGIAEASFTKILDRVAATPYNGKLPLDLREKFVFSEDIVMASPPEDGTFTMSTDKLLGYFPPVKPTTPSTPRLSGESIFKMATVSPIAALVGPTKTSTLTKTYQNNDFRQLSVRQNTSRRPSMHVDDFEQGSGPGLASPIALHQSPPASLQPAEHFQLPPPPKPESE